MPISGKCTMKIEVLNTKYHFQMLKPKAEQPLQGHSWLISLADMHLIRGTCNTIAIKTSCHNFPLGLLQAQGHHAVNPSSWLLQAPFKQLQRTQRPPAAPCYYPMLWYTQTLAHMQGYMPSELSKNFLGLHCFS